MQDSYQDFDQPLGKAITKDFKKPYLWKKGMCGVPQLHTIRSASKSTSKTLETYPVAANSLTAFSSLTWSS